ncbi:MAG: alanine racemase [Dissulfurispiraceae bacterium]
MHRGIVAEIDLEAVSANLRTVKALVGSKAVIAIVKADAYGHGAVDVSKALVRAGADYLAVAFTDEAVKLRETGITDPIIVLFDPDIRDILKYDLIPVLGDRKTALAVSREAEKLGKRIPVHIKVDTGMGRLGLTEGPAHEILEISAEKGIVIEGIMSHLSEADLDDPSFTKVQLDLFSVLKTELLENGLGIKMFHIANSAAVMNMPEAHFDAVRPGLMLYGYSPCGKQVASHGSPLQTVMTAKARFISVRRIRAASPISYARTFVAKRESLIGVVAVGYADGFSTRFSNNAEVLVKGKRAPVVGRVCMDLTMIDLTEIDGVTENDEVIIIGSQGSEKIGADELARRIQAIPYEILTSLGNKAKRIYI